MKRFLIISLILGAVIGPTVAAYYYTQTGPRPATRITDDPLVEIVEIERQTMVDTVNATGSIEPQAEVELNFEITGVIEEVLVKRGQRVTAGTLLARLRTDDLELMVKKAEIELAQKEAELQELFEPETAEKIEASQAKVESARLKLAELIADPNKQDEVTKAAADLNLKQVELKKAQWAYDQVAYRGDVAAMPQADDLQTATIEYETALANYNIAVRDLEAGEADLAEARAALAQSQADLAELLSEPSQTEIATRQAAVDLARIALIEAQQDLEQAVLVSPTEAVVLDVTIEPGERVLQDAQDAAIVLADTSAYLLKVQVDEIDVGRIQPGQISSIVLDAFIEQEFKGEVVDIAPRPSEGDGNSIVTYEVTIAVEVGRQDPGLRSGMTATANIETRRLQDAIVIPTRAIQFERSGQESVIYVEKLDEQGQVSRVEVELGLRDGDVTEVIAGLQAGDRIIIRSQPPAESGPPPNI